MATMQQQTAVAQTPETSPSQPHRADFATIALPAHGRGLAVGGTGSGKTTLEEQVIADWLRRYPRDGRTLILDSKPRFRAEWQLNGLGAKRLYRRWGHGRIVPGSVLLPIGGDPRDNLRQAWAHKHSVAIAQVDRVRGLDDVPWLLAYLRSFFADSDRRRHQLVVIDEAADYFSSSAAYSKGHPMVQVARSGREVGCSLFACSQRPRGIPPSFLTEATQYYVFALDHDKDLAHLHTVGLPEHLSEPSEEFQFLAYNKRTKKHGYYTVDLGGRGDGQR